MRVVLAVLITAVLGAVVALSLNACKKLDNPEELERQADVTGPAVEAFPDGKQVVRGCIWYYASAMSSDGGGTRDVLAFCDDGRVCVQDDDTWKCVQFVSR